MSLGMGGGDVKVRGGCAKHGAVVRRAVPPGGRVCCAQFGAGFLLEEPGEHPEQGGIVL